MVKQETTTDATEHLRKEHNKEASWLVVFCALYQILESVNPENSSWLLLATVFQAIVVALLSVSRALTWLWGREGE